MSQVHYALSFYDLMQYAPFKEAVKNEDKEAMEKILWEAGVDLKQGYEIVSILHRPNTTNEPWFGCRIEGFQRIDKAWLDGGAATLEAHIAACTDPSKRTELRLLNPEGYADYSFDRDIF
jgi:hypothetical protein